MTSQDIALALAGLIGSAVAVVHGVLTQKLMVRPYASVFTGDAREPASLRRLVWALLHFSTVCWFVGGLVLIALSSGVAPGTRTPLAVSVGASFLYGAVGNLWGTRSWHPGWMLMAVSVGLIAFGIG